MDSKNIFIAVQHTLNKIKWIKQTESEWIYVDEANEFNESLVEKMISELFGDSIIYFVEDRHNSFELESSKSLKVIKSELQKTRIILCDKALTKILEFNKIGVVRKGLK